jgi:hypothetical protein
MSENNWINHVKNTQKEHNCSYKQALTIASKTYKTQGGRIINLSNRMGMKPKVRDILSRIGDLPIKYMMICRRAVEKYVSTFVNLIGTHQNHDTLFHLFILINVKGSDYYFVLEKNEDINMYFPYKSKTYDEKMYVDIKQPISLNSMIKNTLSSIGERNFYDYNAISTNCQKFVYDMLKSNNMLTQDASKFIMQDVKDLIPKFAQKIAYYITSFKNRLNQTVEGEGK